MCYYKKCLCRWHATKPCSQYIDQLNWTELTCTKLTQLHDALLVARVSVTKLIGCRAAVRALQFSSVQIVCCEHGFSHRLITACFLSVGSATCQASGDVKCCGEVAYDSTRYRCSNGSYSVTSSFIIIIEKTDAGLNGLYIRDINVLYDFINIYSLINTKLLLNYI